MKAFEITYRTSPKARKTLTAVRFYNCIEDARMNARKVLEQEQGYTVISVKSAKTDPRN
jgi:hypothetical protein